MRNCNVIARALLLFARSNPTVTGDCFVGKCALLATTLAFVHFSEVFLQQTLGEDISAINAARPVDKEKSVLTNVHSAPDQSKVYGF